MALLYPSPPLQLKNWDWRFRAVAFEVVDDILKGVGVPEAINVQDHGLQFALHVRRRTSDAEQEQFKARKDAGDYVSRQLAKGIV